MSVLQVYLNWANSILGEIGVHVENIVHIQEGRALCQVIDILCHDAGLVHSAEESSECSPESYLTTVTEHMVKNNIKFSFKVQDILDGDIKSMLDILWLTILNYGIHNIGRTFHERSVGIGKKLLLEWCQKELSADFDPRNSLTYNLCTGDWFLKLLRIYADVRDPPEDKEEELKVLLQALEKQLGIKQEIISPVDVVEGTIDEHTLMIYISLLKRKVGSDENVNVSQDSIEKEQSTLQGSAKDINTQGTFDKKRISSPLSKHSSVADLADDNSDWFSSSNGSVKSGSQYTGDPQVTQEGESLLIQTISEQVLEHLPAEAEDDEEENISVLSGSISLASTEKKFTKEKLEEDQNKEEKEQEEVKDDSKVEESGTIFTENSAPTSPDLSSNVTKKETKEPIHEPLHTISLTVKRPRTTESIMAEAKQKFENRKQEWKKMEEARNMYEQEGDNISLSSSDMEKSSMKEGDSKSQEEFEEICTENNPPPSFGTVPPHFYPGIGRGMPIFIMPGQQGSPEMMFLLQALRQARHEANFHDQDNTFNKEEAPSRLHNLLDVNEVDDSVPSVIPETPQKRNMRQSPTDTDQKIDFGINHTTTKKPEDKTVLSDFKSGKRGILEVVGDGLEPGHEILDLSKTGSGESKTGSESEGEQRKFPRVDIVEPLKEKMQRDLISGRERKKERTSPERSTGYRSRSLTPGSGYEEETFPKSILKDRSSSRSKSPSLERSSPDRNFKRERLTRSVDFSHDGSPSRSNYEISPRSSLERSPRSSLERMTNNKSPRSPRAKSPQSEQETGGTTSPGRQSRETDPNRRLVRVLNRELELLKMKVDVLEKSNLSDDVELEDIEKVTKELSDHVQEKLSTSPQPRSPRISPVRSPRRSSRSPDFSRGRMFRQNKEDSTSPVRSKSETRSRTSISPDRISQNTVTSRSLQDLSISEAPDGNLTFAPTRRGKPINLGYSSPIRKVSEEIWGINDSDNVGYDQNMVDKWKKLTLKTRMSDQDVIELKQALATAIAENDILQAKLKNSNVEMTEKMSKTNEVLNDCRAHVSRSQAENMELRTQLEKEKTRNESTEERLRETEKHLQSAKSNNDDLEAELEKTRNLLAGSSKQDILTLQSIAEERDNFKEVLANTQRENTELKEDLAREKKLTAKQQSIINDLKNILDDARRERKQLFVELSRSQKQDQLSKVTGIIGKYIENGLYDTDDDEPINGFPKRRHTESVTIDKKDIFPSSQFRADSPGERKPARYRTDSPNERKSPTFRSRSESNENSRRFYIDSFSSTPYKTTSFNSSGRSTPVTFDRENGYEYDEAPPTGLRHEIYPHRRSQSYKTKFNPNTDTEDDSIHDLEVQKYLATKPDFDDEEDDVNDSFIDRVPRKEFRRSPNLRSVSPNRSKSPKTRGLQYSDLTADKSSKRQLLYSPYLMNTDSGVKSRSYVLSPRNSHYDNTKETIECIVESPIDNKYREEYNRQHRYTSPTPNNDKNFIKALEFAVQKEIGPAGQYYKDADMVSPRSSSYGSRKSYSSSLSPQRSASIRGILKNAKSETNLSIKEGINSHHRRSMYSHSLSPSRTHSKEVAPYSSSNYLPYNSKSNSSSGNPTYSSTKRPGVRKSNNAFDDNMSPVRAISPSRYQHQPLRRPIRYEMEDCVECGICRARYNALRKKQLKNNLEITKPKTDLCHSCEVNCQI